MKKFFAVLILLFSTIALLASCSSNKNPSCELKLTSTESSVSYEVSFMDLNEKQTSYKIEICKGDTVVKDETASTTITAGQFTNLELNTNYKVLVYVMDKAEYDACLTFQEIKTKKGTLTGVTFHPQSFIYDGQPKSIEVSNLPSGATVEYTGNKVTDTGEHTVTALVKKENYEDLTLTAKIVITPAKMNFELIDKEVFYDGNAQTIVASTDLDLTYEYYQGETKLEAAPIDAGTYTVKAIYAGDKNHEKLEKTATLTIHKASTNFELSNKEVVYNGEAQTITAITELDLNYEYYAGETKLETAPIDAGTYIVKAIYTGDKNHEELEKTATLTIHKASSSILADDITVKFGETYEVNASCSVVGASLDIAYYQGQTKLEEAPTEIGTYSIKISFAGNKNYAACEKNITLTITNPDYKDVNITLEDITTTYGQNYTVNPTADQNVSLDELVIKYYKAGVEIEKPLNAGEYEIIVSYAGNEENFLNPTTKRVSLTIEKADYDMSGVSFSDVTYTYNGTEKTIVISGTLPAGVTVSYENNTLTNAGNITATAKFEGVDTENYNLIPNKTAVLTIDKATPNTNEVKVVYIHDYEPNMTLEVFKTMLEENKLFLEDYTIVLKSGENILTAIYRLGSNYADVELEITLKCNPIVIDFEVVDGERQISGRDFDKNNLVIKYIYNDGKEELVASSFTTSSITDTTTPFTVEVTISDKNYKGEIKTKSVQITPIEAPKVMIYAVYGGGGNSGAPYTNDFIILYNGSNQDVDLTDWSLQYGSAKATGNLSGGDSNLKKLSGIIKAYGFYTIIAAKGNNIVSDLPFQSTADEISALAIGATNFKIYLSTTTTSINADNFNSTSCVDMVGAGTATNVEGTAAPGPNATSYIKRKALLDTDNNANDFELVNFDGTNDFNYLAEGYTAYNYAFSVIEEQNIEFMNLKSGFTLPMEYDGTTITWTVTPEGGLEIVDGIATIVATEYYGKLIGTIAGYPLALEYNVVISNRVLLTTPTVSLNHFTISWVSIPDAAAYDIYVDGVLYATTTETSYDLYDSSFATTFVDKKSYSITVIAKIAEGDTTHANSLASTPVSLNFADLSDISQLNGAYTFKVTVTEKGVWSTKYGNVNFFVRDYENQQGLLVYRYNDQTIFDCLTVGNIIYITGTYSISNGMPQIGNVKGITITEATQSLDEITVARELTITDIGQRINLTNAEVTTKASGGNVTVKVGEYTYNLYANTSYLSSIDEINTLLPGNTLNFIGVVGAYKENLQVYLTSYEITSVEVNDDYKLEITASEVSPKLNNTYNSGAIVNDMLTNGTTYPDVTISYSVMEGNEFVTIEESTITFGTVLEATLIKIKVVLSVNGATSEFEKEITLKPAGSSEEKTMILKYTGSTTGNMDAGTTLNNSKSIGDENNIFNVTSSKNSASNQVGLNKSGQMRLYGHTSGSGTSLTIIGKEVNITKVVVQLQSASGKSQVSINGNTAQEIGTTVSKIEVGITDNTFSIQNVNTSTVQVYILSITIYYTI